MGLLIFGGIFLIGALGAASIAGIVGLNAKICWVISRRLAPKWHRPMGSYKDSQGWLELNAEHFDVTPDWRSDAVARLPKS